MKLYFCFRAVLYLSMLTSALSAMEVVPSLNRLSLQVVAKSVSPTQFIEKPFIYTVGHLYPEVGLELIGRDDIHDKDKAAAAKSVITEVLEGVARETDFDKKLKPFITVFAQRYVKDTLAPNPYITFRAVKAFKDSVTNALAELQISEESKKLLKDDTTIALINSLVPLYTSHAYVFERVKASLLENIEAAEIPEALKGRFEQKIHRIKPLEEKIELEKCKRDFKIGAQAGCVAYITFLSTLMAEIACFDSLSPYVERYNPEFIGNPYLIAACLSSTLGGGYHFIKKMLEIQFLDKEDEDNSLLRSRIACLVVLGTCLTNEPIVDFIIKRIYELNNSI